MNLRAAQLGVDLEFCQSSSEAVLVDFINDNSHRAAGIIINPAGLTTIGYPLLDACIDSGVPVVEVHLSNIYGRESWRSPSIFARAVAATVAGMRWMGYISALDYLHALTKKEV
jgi:3-dehydroquinate dehydratase-2